MEVKDVNFKRFIADEGMALKWREKSWNYKDNNVCDFPRWSPYCAIIDINNIVGDVEEITMEQYDEETKNCCVGFAGF